MIAKDAITAMQDRTPLVQCITNYVSMDLAANVLLAAGAAPAMLHAKEETEEFTPVVDALTVNFGTADPDWAAGMQRAVAAARQSGTPWILDPVALYASSWRMRLATDLAESGPAVIRGNASEIIVLAGGEGAGRGPEAGDTVDAAEDAARHLAERTGAVIAVTGPRDLILGGGRSVRVSGGDPLMGRITAMGCSLTALIGAYAAVARPFEAAEAALCHFAAAAERAASQSAGPGSFRVAFVDALAAVRPEDLDGYIG